MGEMQRTPRGDDLLTVEEVAEMLRVSGEQVRKLCDRTLLRSIDVGLGKRRIFRVRRSWVQEFIQTRESTFVQAVRVLAANQKPRRRPMSETFALCTSVETSQLLAKGPKTLTPGQLRKVGIELVGWNKDRPFVCMLCGKAFAPRRDGSKWAVGCWICPKGCNRPTPTPPPGEATQRPTDPGDTPTVPHP